MTCYTAQHLKLTYIPTAKSKNKMSRSSRAKQLQGLIGKSYNFYVTGCKLKLVS